MRAKTNFKGWQNEVDFEANEAERQKRVELAVAAYKQMMLNKREQHDIRRISSSLRWTIILFSVAFACWMLYLGLNWLLRQVGL